MKSILINKSLSNILFTRKANKYANPLTRKITKLARNIGIRNFGRILSEKALLSFDGDML